MNVALVHDWLTGMRGGEKVLEALCERYPHAEIFTLLGGETYAALAGALDQLHGHMTRLAGERKSHAHAVL